MRTPRTVAVLVAAGFSVGCGSGADEPPGSASAPVPAAGESGRNGAQIGFDAIEDVELATMRVATTDLEGAEATFDAYGGIDGWLASYDYGGSAEATITFEPHAEDLEAAVENHDAVRTALESLGTVTDAPYAAVVASFRAAAGSPLDRDALTASDVFDDLAGCDWDGGALMADHVWYCEARLDGRAAAVARDTFARRAGIEPSAVTLTLYH